MSHIDKVIDADPHFIIDIATRDITNASEEKVSLVQYDHNSERFSFTLPRYVEGHDMTMCNSIKVHYINLDTKTQEEHKGVYEVKDIAICEDNPDNVCCTWLISQNVTKSAGLLKFILCFSCIAEDSEIEYAWHTNIFTGISIAAGINNSEEVVEQYADILEQWKAELEAAAGGTVTTDNLQFKDSIIIGHALNGATAETCDVLYQDGSNFVDTFNSACEIATEKGINTIKILSGDYICSKPFYIEKEVNIIGDAMPYIYLSPEPEKDFEGYGNGLIQITASNVGIDGVKIGVVPQDHSLGMEGDNIKINGVVCEGDILLFKDFGTLISSTCKSVIAMEEFFEEGGSRIPKNCIIANNIVEESIDVPFETNVVVGNIIAGVPQSGGAGADGKSAYEIAVEKGFEGTEEEWLESLKGTDGETVNAWVGDAPEIYHIGKNILDLSKIIRSGDGNIDAKTGEVVDGSYYVYGKYDLTVGETYTISKATGNAVWLYFYNADGSYVKVESVFSIGATETEKTFEAVYPLVAVVSMKEPTSCNVQIELGETATDYEPYCVKLNEEVIIPVVGDEELNTEAKTLIGAVNELKENTDKMPILEADVSENTDDIFEIEKVLPRLNEQITGWTFEFIGADGKLIASNTTWYSSNKILLLAGKTYNILGAYLGYTVYYDVDGNFLGRGTDCESIITVAKNNYAGTVTVGESDVYAVLQTIPSKIETAYISRYVGEKASADICEKLLVNKNLMDKKVLIFGDSITTGDTSAKVHAGEKYGNYNKWVEALIEDKYFAEYNVRNDSIHATGFVARFQGEDDLITRLRNTKDTDYDLVIVFAGINDSLRANSIEVGFGMDEQGNKETDILKYFVPAVDTFFAMLVEKFVKARICVVLPLRTRYTYAGHGATAPVTLADGSTSRPETDYADYIAKVAKEYCLPVLDATYQSGFAPFNTTFGEEWVNLAARGNGDTTLVPDGVHPNEAYCKKYLSKYIRGFIDGLI